MLSHLILALTLFNLVTGDGFLCVFEDDDNPMCSVKNLDAVGKPWKRVQAGTMPKTDSWNRKKGHFLKLSGYKKKTATLVPVKSYDLNGEGCIYASVNVNDHTRTKFSIHQDDQSVSYTSGIDKKWNYVMLRLKPKKDTKVSLTAYVEDVNDYVAVDEIYFYEVSCDNIG